MLPSAAASTKIISTASENIDIGLNAGNALLVSITGDSFVGTVDFQSTIDGVTYANHPYLVYRDVDPTVTVAQITNPSTVAVYVMTAPITQARIAVAWTSGSVSIRFVEIKGGGHAILATHAADGDAHHAVYTDAEAIAAVEGEATLVLGGNTTLQTLDLGDLVEGDIIYGSAADVLSILQKGSDTEVLTLASGVPSWAAPAGAGGLTEVDQYRVDTGFTGAAAPIASNWERPDTDGFGKPGTGLSESSGLFSFPSTGIYLIRAHANFNGTASGDPSITLAIMTTTDDSTYNAAASTVANIPAQNDLIGADAEFLFDVTNVATHKFRIDIQGAAAGITTVGSSTQNQTYITVERVAAT